MSSIFSALSLVSDLISTVTSVDVVGIYDADRNPLFANAQYMRAEVKESSQVMRHPVETGTMIADNHIINQVEINLLLMIKSQFYNSTYNELKQNFIAGSSLLVQTRTGVYANMIIGDMPHTEDADIYDAVVMHLHLVEVLYVVPSSVSALAAPANYSPADPVNSNTVQAGLKSPASISAANMITVQSSLTSIVSGD